jgi:hypothetical protein
MSITKSQQAAAAWVTGPLTRAHARARARARQAGLGAPDPSRPRAETVRVLKSRSYVSGELHVVAFTTVAGEEWAVFLRTVLDKDGSYRVESSALSWLTAPTWPPPWANIATSIGTSCFRGGGKVFGPGAESTQRVRLHFANGVTLEDDVENGSVLFEATLAVEPPLEVDLVDGAGNLLSSHTELE